MINYSQKIVIILIHDKAELVYELEYYALELDGKLGLICLLGPYDSYLLSEQVDTGRQALHRNHRQHIKYNDQLCI